MHPTIYSIYEEICTERHAGEPVLEIGAVPSEESLLNMKSLRHLTEKIGVNMDGSYSYQDFNILKENANDLSCFQDGQFATVLCNAVLEHDKCFWKTIAEIKRVTQSGGLIVIGTPGYTQFKLDKYLKHLAIKSPFLKRHVGVLINSTLTYHIHNAPGDYYRFSPQAFKEVFFEGLNEVQIQTVMMPPRIIGTGIKPD